MAPRALPGFLALYRSNHQHTFNVAQLRSTVARMARTWRAALVELRRLSADREIARVLRVRIEDLPDRRQARTLSATPPLNLHVRSRV